MDDDIRANKSVYIVRLIDNIDGTMSQDCETTTFLTEKEAIEFCRLDEYGSEFVIYHSRPIWKRERRMTMQRVKP